LSIKHLFQFLRYDELCNNNMVHNGRTQQKFDSMATFFEEEERKTRTALSIARVQKTPGTAPHIKRNQICYFFGSFFKIIKEDSRN